MTTPPIKITHHCEPCGNEIPYDAEGCPDHPGAEIVSVATPAVPGTARLTERKRERSRCCDVAGAMDIELGLQVYGLIGHTDLGAAGVAGTVRITLAPRRVSSQDSVEGRSSTGMHPISDTLDAWLSNDGVLARIPECARVEIVDELANWLGDERRVVDLDLSEVAS